MKVFFKYLVFIISLSSCSSNKNISGVYKDNHDGSTVKQIIHLKNNESFEMNFYKNSKILENSSLVGKYTIKKQNLYLQFSIKDSNLVKVLGYKTKNEDGIEYHIKCFIKKNKLYPLYKNDKFVPITYNTKRKKKNTFNSEKGKYSIITPIIKRKKLYFEKLN